MQENAPTKNGTAQKEKHRGAPFSTLPTTQNKPKKHKTNNAKKIFFFILNTPFLSLLAQL